MLAKKAEKLAKENKAKLKAIVDSEGSDAGAAVAASGTDAGAGAAASTAAATAATAAAAAAVAAAQVAIEKWDDEAGIAATVIRHAALRGFDVEPCSGPARC